MSIIALLMLVHPKASYDDVRKEQADSCSEQNGEKPDLCRKRYSTSVWRNTYATI
jgi:hypothetical protein